MPLLHVFIIVVYFTHNNNNNIITRDYVLYLCAVKVEFLSSMHVLII